MGYGVLRAPATGGSGIASLIMSYGPSASHGHPDKLHIDLWALDDILMPSPGVIYPYSDPMDWKWYGTTLSHNTLTVDEQSQRRIVDPRKRDPVRADQTVYGPAETFGVQRAWSDTVYAGVTMDRAVFFTGSYLADLFGVASGAPHRYDLAWHIRGAPKSDLAFVATSFPAPVPDGYVAFTDVQQAQATHEAFSVAFDQGSRSARLISAGGAETTPILALGGPYADSTQSKHGMPTAPTLIERRDAVASTVFGNVLDYSGGAAGSVKTVTREGSLEAGYGLLRIETAEGVDLGFASYGPGPHSAAGLSTDALQAFVRTKAGGPFALYLGGGTVLDAGEASIRRSETGLAYVEETAAGVYVLGNPSPAGATVTVKLKALRGLEAFELNSAGKPGRKSEAAANADGDVSLRLEGGARVGFFPPGRVKS